MMSAGNVFGTYVHGIFDNDQFRRAMLNAVRRNKKLPPLHNARNRRAEKQAAYDRLARIVGNALNMDRLQDLING